MNAMRAAGLLLFLFLLPVAAADVTDNAGARRLADRCGELAAQAKSQESIAAAGGDGWLFLASDLAHVARMSAASKPGEPDPYEPALAAIVDFQQQLQRAGIDLLLVPVPPKPVIYPDILTEVAMVDGQPPRLDQGQQALNKRLADKGVAVLDLTPAFLTGRAKVKEPIYCQQDSHWSGAGCVLAAQRIAAEIGERPWVKEQAIHQYGQRIERREIDGDLRAAFSGVMPPKEIVSLRIVSPPNDDRGTASPAGGSIILLGDSHNLVFHAGGDMHAVGAGLSDQLAFELRQPIDVVAVRGSGASAARINLMRKVKANPNYLNGKRLVIWCFASREFTQVADWPKVPVVPARSAK